MPRRCWGSKQVYPGRYEPDHILAMREREGVSFSHCVPTVLQMLLNNLSGQRLDGWHFVIGGSAMTRELFDAATAAGAAVTAGYGMSETGPLVAIARPGVDRYDAIRSGTPVPLISARIVGSDMSDLAADDDALGELVVRSPWLTPCYWAMKQPPRNCGTGVGCTLRISRRSAGTVPFKFAIASRM